MERPRTFTIQNNDDGTVTLIPAEGKVNDPGTPIMAANMNKIEEELVRQDERVTTHSEDNEKHLRSGERTRITNAVQKTGDTMTGELKIKKGASSGIEPTGVWMQNIVNGVDAPDENGISIATRYGIQNSKILEVAKLWTGTSEAYVPILTVRGDSVVDIKGTLLVDGVNLKQSASEVKNNVSLAIREKGGTADSSYTGVQLANAIRAIQTGRKEATGIRTNGSTPYIDITNSFDFTPKIVLIRKVGGFNKNTDFAIYVDPRILSVNESQGISAYLQYTGAPADIHNTGSIIMRHGGFRADVSTGSSGNNYYWMAFS